LKAAGGVKKKSPTNRRPVVQGAKEETTVTGEKVCMGCWRRGVGGTGRPRSA